MGLQCGRLVHAYRKKSYRTFDFVYVLKIVHTEILGQAIAQRFNLIAHKVLDQSQDCNAFIS